MIIVHSWKFTSLLLLIFDVRLFCYENPSKELSITTSMAQIPVIFNQNYSIKFFFLCSRATNELFKFGNVFDYIFCKTSLSVEKVYSEIKSQKWRYETSNAV